MATLQPCRLPLVTRLVFEPLPYGAILRTTERILYANPKAHDLLGLPPRSLDGQERALQGGVALVQADGSHARGPVRRVIQSGQPILEARYGLRYPTGDVRWIDLTSIPLVDEESQARCALTTFADANQLAATQHGHWLREKVLQSVLGISLVLQRHLDAHPESDKPREDVEWAIRALHDLATDVRSTAKALTTTAHFSRGTKQPPA
jgi:PAS fold